MARNATGTLPEPGRNTQRISVTLPQDDYSALKTLAEIEHQSMDWLAAQAVRRFLDVKAADAAAIRQSRLDLSIGADE